MSDQELDRVAEGAALGCLSIDYPLESRVRLAPHTDAFMQGVRYGKVTNYAVEDGNFRLTVACERTRINVKVAPADVEVIA